MPDVSIDDRIRKAQATVKALQASRDQINREVGIEETKLAQAYERLRELGVESPEKKSPKELQALADQLKIELAEKMLVVEEKLAQGEALMQRYSEIQRGKSNG